jgi:tetratricopeptide (TPR) repeat protein
MPECVRYEQSPYLTPFRHAIVETIMNSITVLLKKADEKQRWFGRIWSCIGKVLEHTVTICKLGLLVFILINVFTIAKPWERSITVIESIRVPQELQKDGFTEDAIQRLLASELSKARTEARHIIPDDDKERIESDLSAPDIAMPGVGVSLQQMVELLRAVRSDSSIYGSFHRSPDGLGLQLTYRATDGSITPLEVNPRKPEHADEPLFETIKLVLGEATGKIMKERNGLTYAAYLTQLRQERCFEKQECKFDDVLELYGKIAASGEKLRTESTVDAAWALLAISKLDSLQGDYTGSILSARQIIQEGEWRKVHAWAYYNWGVALRDMGCYRQAVDVLKQAVKLKKNYTPAKNALARAAILSATQSGPALTEEVLSYKALAVDHLSEAIRDDPKYAEAYINLGDALSIGATSKADAIDAYEAAAKLAPHEADRALGRLKAANVNLVAARLDKISHNDARKKCRLLRGSRSLLESWGCSDEQIQAANANSTQTTLAVAFVNDGASCGDAALTLPGSATRAPVTTQRNDDTAPLITARAQSDKNATSRYWVSYR